MFRIILLALSITALFACGKEKRQKSRAKPDVESADKEAPSNGLGTKADCMGGCQQNQPSDSDVCNKICSNLCDEEGCIDPGPNPDFCALQGGPPDSEDYKRAKHVCDLHREAFPFLHEDESGNGKKKRKGKKNKK